MLRADRLLAVGDWKTGLWIHALLSPNIGTLSDDTTFRLTSCLRLGALCMYPLFCQCGEAVESLGHHDFSCSRSAKKSHDVILTTLYVVLFLPSVFELREIIILKIRVTRTVSKEFVKYMLLQDPYFFPPCGNPLRDHFMVACRTRID